MRGQRRREWHTVAVTTSTKNKMNLNEATPAIKCKRIFIIKLPVLVNLKRRHLFFYEISTFGSVDRITGVYFFTS